MVAFGKLHRCPVSNRDVRSLEAFRIFQSLSISILTKKFINLRRIENRSLDHAIVTSARPDIQKVRIKRIVNRTTISITIRTPENGSGSIPVHSIAPIYSGEHDLGRALATLSISSEAKQGQSGSFYAGRRELSKQGRVICTLLVTHRKNLLS